MILFDLGGVLIDTDFDRLAVLFPELDPVILRTRWLDSPSVRQFELGLIEPTEFASRFIREWALTISPDAFIELFTSWPDGPYPGARELVTLVRQKHRVGCLSNCNILHWERFDAILPWFDQTYSSHLLGAIKPDAAIFHGVASLSGEAPRDIWLLDDSPSNVEAAQEAGFRSFLVQGVEQTRTVLSEQGLID
ncbi:HAD-IA family hydrolase [Gemmatimonadota bacterium]